ncbi:MAG: glycosyl hydrolase [Spirochaetaceae bacterium]|nr:glycosyl hydrolase [Spirochaetaceae bacterium]
MRPGPATWRTRFQAQKGYDIRDVLPAIFRDDEATAQVRIDYFDWWSRRFAEAFFGQIQEWSARNGLWSIGHLGGEDLTIGSRKYGFGHVMRVLRKYDIPGVDTIWKQLHPGRKAVLPVHWDDTEGSLPVADNHHFPKYASSVAHQRGTPWSWTESFSAYGCALTLEEMKWITDFQFVRGINLLISGQALLSTKGHYMGSIRPMFVRENPLFRHMDLYHAYTARLSYLLSLGRPAIRAALYFPVRDIWAGGAELDRVAGSNDMLARTLLAHQCDFDMIDDDLLEDEATIVRDGCIQAGPMRYDTVYVSRTRHMSGGSREKLDRFIAAGGRVYWVDNGDGSEAPAGSTSIELDELDARHVEPLVDVHPANAGVRVCRRDLENGTLYFLTNEGTGVGKEEAVPAGATIFFKDHRPVIRIDPETGTCSTPEDAAHVDGTCSVPLRMRFAESYVFLFTDDDIPSEPARSPHPESRIPIDEGWTCRRTRAFWIGDEEFEVQDVHQEASPIALGDWSGAVGHDFTGDAEYRVAFELDGPEAARASTLDLGQVWGVAEVVLNGVPLGRRAWEPFRLDLNGAAKAGTNTLSVTVTNTMANQFLHTRKLDRWPDNVLGIYHKQCLALEQGCTRSGLCGPVSIGFE